MSCAALFYDGPLAGRVQAFDRDVPPPRFYHEKPGSLVRDKQGAVTVKMLTYVRDVNPFPDGEAWIYLLKEKD